MSYEGEAINTRIEGEAITAENIMDILGKIIRQNFLMTTKGIVRAPQVLGIMKKKDYLKKILLSFDIAIPLILVNYP